MDGLDTPVEPLSHTRAAHRSLLPTRASSPSAASRSPAAPPAAEPARPCRQWAGALAFRRPACNHTSPQPQPASVTATRTTLSARRPVRPTPGQRRQQTQPQAAPGHSKDRVSTTGCAKRAGPPSQASGTSELGAQGEQDVPGRAPCAGANAPYKPLESARRTPHTQHSLRKPSSPFKPNPGFLGRHRRAQTGYPSQGGNSGGRRVGQQSVTEQNSRTVQRDG